MRYSQRVECGILMPLFTVRQLWCSYIIKLTSCGHLSFVAAPVPGASARQSLPWLQNTCLHRYFYEHLNHRTPHHLLPGLEDKVVGPIEGVRQDRGMHRHHCDQEVISETEQEEPHLLSLTSRRGQLELLWSDIRFEEDPLFPVEQREPCLFVLETGAIVHGHVAFPRPGEFIHIHQAEIHQ